MPKHPSAVPVDADGEAIVGLAKLDQVLPAGLRADGDAIVGLLDYPAAARWLSTTERHVKKLVYERRVTYVKVGRLVRFRLTDLEAYVAASVVEATTR